MSARSLAGWRRDPLGACGLILSIGSIVHWGIARPWVQHQRRGDQEEWTRAAWLIRLAVRRRALEVSVARTLAPLSAHFSGSGVPHLPQNLAVAAFAWPHDAQDTGNAAPHSVQNQLSSDTSAAQLGQRMPSPFFGWWDLGSFVRAAKNRARHKPREGPGADAYHPGRQPHCGVVPQGKGGMNASEQWRRRSGSHQHGNMSGFSCLPRRWPRS
jgi:hypothetical protein